MWRAQSFDYAVCVAGDEVRVRRRDQVLAWRYLGREGVLVAEPEGRAVTRISEFRGADPAGWRRAEPAFAGIRVVDLYPGVDLVMSDSGGRLKLDYVVAPFVNPAQIRIRFLGVRRVRVGGHGGLIIETPAGDWIEDEPYLYQPGAPHQPVRGRVVTGTDFTAGFEVEQYDPSLPLVIDPVLSFSTLLGDAGSSSPQAVAVGPAGEIVVAGFTDSSSFPAVNPQRSFAGGVEAVIVKLAADGASILQATFLGGSGDDRAFAAAVDPEGGVYVAGWTTSGNFPAVNAWRASLSGYRDAFLARLSPAGDSLTFSTFLGGGGEEHAAALAADAAGVWVAGDTNSQDFPLLAALRSSPSGSQDGFVARFSKTGAAVSSSYLGGNGTDTIRALAVTPSGDVYVAGGATSTDLPVPAQAWRTQPGGGQDGFILRLNPAASAVTAGTYLGGAAGGVGATELVQSLAIAPNAEVVAGGSTPSSNFPLQAPWVAVHRGTSMGFVARLLPDLSGAAWSTFLGGMNSDRVEAVAVDQKGRVFAAGRTFSLDLPLAAPLQASYQGEGDAFLHVLSPEGGTLVFGTYLGGQSSDAATALALTAAGNAVVAGVSNSLNFPSVQALASPSQPAPRFFVSLVGMAFHAPEPVSVTPSSAAGQEQVFEILVRDADGAADLKTVLVLIHSNFSSSGACYISAEPGPNLLSLASDSGLAWSGVTAGGAATLSNSQCRLRASGSGFALTGQELRLTLDLAFEPSFAGQKTIYVLSTDQGLLSSNWAQPGSYTVTAGGVSAPPVAAAIHPLTAAGSRQTFSLTVTDPNGGADVKEGRILVNTMLGESQACLVRFTVSPPQLHLAADSGAGWTTAAAGSATVLQNGRCLVHALGSGVAVGLTSAVFWADIEFKPAWTGLRRIWGKGADQAGFEAPWTELAHFTVADGLNHPPVLESMTPPGSGGGIFSFEVADPDGSEDLRALHVLIGEQPVSTQGCLIVYDTARPAILLNPDQAGAGWPSVTPGQAGTAENARCRLRGEGTSIAPSGPRSTFRLQIEFKPGFTGPKAVKAHILDAAGAQSTHYRLFGWHTLH